MINMKSFLVCLGLLLFLSCGSEKSDAWPENYEEVLTFEIIDETDDLILANSDAPPLLIPFEPMDVRKVSLGFFREHFYMRVDFAGIIPEEQIEIVASDSIEQQWVRNQSVSVVIDSDNSDATGASGEGVKGVDIFFALNFIYGSYAMQYANFGFDGSDIHIYNGSTQGELGGGGPGTDYAIIRFEKDAFSSYLAPGMTVEIGGWAESESVDSEGVLKYHHFAFDTFEPQVWSVE